ncbi:MAG TPA: hypothetical protein V6D08_07970 [Candidatus Obscuribacterales bacterium]
MSDFKLVERVASVRLPAVLLAICSFFSQALPAQAQKLPPCDRIDGCEINIPPRPVRDPPRFIPPPPPQIQTPPPRVPVFVPPPAQAGLPTPTSAATDVTNTALADPGLADIGVPELALLGVKVSKDFPGPEEFTGETTGIDVRAVEGSEFSRPNPYTVDLRSGAVLVSVRKPSHLALVSTKYGEAVIAANGTFMIQCASPLRVLNIDARGDNVKVKIKPMDGLPEKVVTLAPGYELVVGPEKLGRQDLRPSDGLARRHSKILENGHMAVSEFSVESFLTTSQLIAQMAQEQTPQVKQNLAAMSKMAAVLNQLNGVQGFVASSPSSR